MPLPATQGRTCRESHPAPPVEELQGSVEIAPANSWRHSWPLPAPMGESGAITGTREAGRHSHSRGVGAELALKGVAVVRWDLGLGDQLGHLLPDATRQVPHIAIPLQRDRGICGWAGGHPLKTSQGFPRLATAQLSYGQSRQVQPGTREAEPGSGHSPVNPIPHLGPSELTELLTAAM